MADWRRSSPRRRPKASSASTLGEPAVSARHSAPCSRRTAIVEGSFDPRYEPSYWIRFGLGLIAGLILTELVPFVPAADGEPARFAKPLLALLGGFSAVLVYRILERLVTTVDGLVRGDTRDILAARNSAAEARLAEQSARSRFATAARLIPLQQQLVDGSSSEEVGTRLARILDKLPDGGLEADSPTRSSSAAGRLQTSPGTMGPAGDLAAQ